jgi:acyl-CoA synthetase (AMP-forming)/AMP-acid ligase II
MWNYPEIRFLADALRYHAHREPGRTAMVFEGRAYSYAAVEAESSQLANGLIAAGAAPGDRVVYFGKNSADFFLALFGTAKSGACFTPLNWRLVAVELGVIVADARPRFAFVEREFLPVWQEVCALAERDVQAVIFDDASPLSSWCAAQAAQAPAVRLREDDAVIQLYTSGTTGVPKGVLHTHASFNHSRLSEHFERAFDWRDGDMFLYALPNFHLLGIALALQCLYNGVALAIHRQFQPAEYLQGIARRRPTLLVLTPTMIQMLVDHPDAATTDFSALRLCMYAGSPISLGLIKRALTIMPCQFMQFYGQTETSGPVSLLRPDEHDLNNEQTLKSCGRPLPLIRMRVVDAEGQDLPVGMPGELLVSAPAASAGYWNRPEETAQRFKDGWYHTGDVAYCDEQGLFYIYDRVKDMIVSGGENIYCAEIENVLSLHPAVASVAVIGVPDARWGEAVKAMVVLRAGAEVTETALAEFCRGRLAGYKVPKSIDFLDALPMTGTGKISKKDLRAPFWASMKRSVA